VIKFLEVFENKKFVFFVMEYASGGDLLKYIKDNGRIKEPIAK
jgi:serine/threonine protein kinase